MDLIFKNVVSDIKKVASELKQTVGVVEHGIFVDMASVVMVGSSGGIRVATSSVGGEVGGNLGGSSVGNGNKGETISSGCTIETPWWGA